MSAPAAQHYVMPPWMPAWAVYLLAAAAIAAWALVRRATRRAWAGGDATGGDAGAPAGRSAPAVGQAAGRVAADAQHPRASATGRALAFAARVAAGFLAMLAAAQAMQAAGLVLATNWPVWPIALLGAAAVEAVLALYDMERRTVSRGVGLTLGGLRAALVALVVIMLAQPVRPWTLDRTIQRFVAVLLDESASMHVPDSQLTPSEKMRLAEKFGPAGLRRGPALDATAEAMEKVRADLAAQGEWLASLGAAAPDERQKALLARREGLHRALGAAEKRTAELLAELAEPPGVTLTPDAVLRMEDVRNRLGTSVRDRLREAATLTARDNAGNLEREHGRLLAAVRQAAADLADAAAKTVALAQVFDELAYAALAPDLKSRVDALAQRKRIALARDVLLARPAADSAGAEPTERGPSMLDRLRERYALKLYRFASAPAEVDLANWAETYAATDANPTADAAALPPEQQQTDLASAIEKVMTEMADKQLSGILLLTDGRHNVPKPVEPLVRRLGLGQVPVSSVVLGGERPPIDAGVLSVEAPETAAAGDRILVAVQLKLDGLAGQQAKVSLLDGDKTVDSREIRVPTDAYRVRAELADEPQSAGMHRYRVEVQKFEGEVMTANNQYPVAVSVTDERTKLLLVDGRPRWEFRYLKNLFATRDKTVRLQYVLMEPDWIDGVPPAPKVEASASRPLDEVEASLLPKDQAEWMKFDVIILGDVGPKHLTEEHFKILQKFVADRGGTLVVVAGPAHMPHAYAGTPLAEILPVVFKKEDKPVLAGPEKSFRVALTAEGRESVIMRQRLTPEENLEVWESMPEIFWRHPILHAKEGATVLAYALPPSPPDFLPKRGAAAGDAADAPTDEILRLRRQFERENALIAYHGVAMGQVMFLAFDHTWRLRYRVGDTYHHRFWGQVLRWATANKLPAGTETVKLGTDRSRYPPHAPVRVRAKLAQKDYTPIVSEDVAVNVFEGDRLRLHRKLRYVENSPGMYEAELGELPGGTYRVELHAPPARTVLAEEGVVTVAAEFSVEPSAPAEHAELAPDRGLLSRLAAMTGGTVADPARAERVLASLGKPTEVQIERHEFVLWNSWPLLILMVLAATAEWLLRKKAGLA